MRALFRKLQAISGIMKLGRTENATHDPYYRETASEYSETPIGELQQKAASGDPDAKTRLALCYEIGEENTQDFEEAAQLYRLAADNGFAPAMSNLGYLVEHALGMEADIKEGHSW
jgi:hypothetical protein